MTHANDAPAPPSRRGLMLGAAALGLAGGLGLAWWRQRLNPSEPQALDLLWSRELPTPSGAKLPLISLRGRPLVINFWATWCPPCVKEMPELDRFARAHAPQGWQVLGIALDQAEAVSGFLSTTPVSFPVVVAGTDALAWVRALGNPTGGLPFTVLVNAQGELVQRKMGATTADELAQWARQAR